MRIAAASCALIFSTLVAPRAGIAAESTIGTSPNGIYLIRLADAPLAAYDGGRDAVVHNGAKLAGTSAESRGRARLDTEGAAAQAYLGYLDQRRDGVLARAGKALGRSLSPDRVYRYGANGMALRLSPAEAMILRGLDGVVAVVPDSYLRPQTDAGPTWIGANQVWQGTIPSSNLQGRGEGTVVGIIDTGINASHPSFADIGGDGYDHVNPKGRLFGKCVETPARCNDKLIGIYDYTNEGAKDGSDIDGHGSHVASTAVGNTITSNIVSPTLTLPLTVSGVAPHASLIMYKVCAFDSTANQTLCANSNNLAAVDQAMADGVNAINFSIGGGAQDPWTTVRNEDFNTADEMLKARTAGIFIAVSAGNNGPYGFVTNPANSPWVTTVANASHGRQFLTRLTVDDPLANLDPPPTYDGAALTGAAATAPLVYAGDFGNALCGTGTPELSTSPTGASNPFPPGTFHGEIVICLRGTYGRIEKGFNVKLGGAGGMVLINAVSDGEVTVADGHFLPATHLGYTAGQAMLALQQQIKRSGHAASGQIRATQRVFVDAAGDILATSSSRGPVVPYGGWLKPNITAPGTGILAAAPTGSGLATLSGTSMASPHVAGAAALLASIHRDWRADQIESALLTTGIDDVRREDGVTPARHTDAGAGRAWLPEAARAGLYFPVSRAEFTAADPVVGGSPSTLNMPYLVSESCRQRCSFTRNVTSMSSVTTTWTATFNGSAGAVVTVNPPSFTLAPGATQALTIEVDVSDPRLASARVEGEVRLAPGSAAVATSRIPLSVLSTIGSLPAAVSLLVNSNALASHVDLSGLVALPDLSPQVSSLERAVTAGGNLVADPTRSDPFDDLTKGVVYTTLTVPANTDPATQSVLLFAQSTSATARDVDLYVGFDSNGDGKPNADETLCRSAGPTAFETCKVTLPTSSVARTFWVLAQNFSGNGIGTDLVGLVAGAPRIGGAPNRRLVVTGPGHVDAGAAFSLNVAVHEPRMQLGDLWIGAAAFKATRDAAVATTIPLVLNAVTPFTVGDEVLGGPMTTGEDGAIDLELLPGAAHDRIVLDVPLNASTLHVATSGSGEVDLYVARGDAASTAGPGLLPAKARNLAEGSSVHPGATEQVDLVPGSISPGRWYLTPVNVGTTRASVHLSYDLAAGGPAPTLRTAGYFNPARSGHGMFISYGNVDRVLIWYAYDADRNPVWYYAQAAIPAANEGIWSADLYRFSWNGSANTGVVVGRVVLTPTSANRYQFSALVDGQYISEPMSELANQECPLVGGQPRDYSGSWYAPQLPGYGWSVLTLGRAEVQIAYLYDGHGDPRWLYGQVEPFGNPTIPMSQFRGFCPGCSYTVPTSQVVGSLLRRFDSVQRGHAALNASFGSPLVGSWSTDQDTAKLTIDLACP